MPDIPKLPQYQVPPITAFPSLKAGEKRRRVVLVAGRSDYSLTLIGPLNVLQTANFVLDHSGRPDLGYDFEVVKGGSGPILNAHGLNIAATVNFDQLKGRVDTLLVAPMEFEELFGDPAPKAFLAWVKKMSGRVRRIGSFCSATYILAAAGVLKGRRATTHWDLEKDFKMRYPDVHLDVDPIYVKDDHIYTSAGMSASMDLMLALVEEDFGREAALRTAQALVVFMKRPGSQAQFSTQLTFNLPETSPIAHVQSHIHENPDDDLRIDRLAEIANMSPRNFSRTFTKEVGIAPGRYVELMRLELARQRLEDSSLPISKVAHTCGYGSADAMRMAFERRLGLTPRDYRARFTSAQRERPLSGA